MATTADVAVTSAAGAGSGSGTGSPAPASTGQPAGGNGAGGGQSTAGMTDEQILSMPSVGSDKPASTEVPKTEEAQAGAQKEDAQQQQDQNTPQTDAKGRDWRTVPQDIREALRGNEKLADMFFAHRDYQTAFGTPAEAKTVADAIGQIGGAAKLSEQLADLKSFRDTDTAYFSKDVSTIEQMHDRMVREALTSNDTQTYLRNFYAGAKALAQWMPAAYEQIAMQILPSALESSGFSQIVRFAEQLVNGGKDASGLGKHLVDYAKALADAGKAPEQGGEQRNAATDQDRQKLNQDREHFEQSVRQEWNRGTDEQIRSGIREDVAALVKSTLGDGTPAGAVSRIVDNVADELDKALRADQELTKQIVDAFAPMREQGNKALTPELREKVSQLMRAAAKRLVPKVAETVINDWTSNVMGRHQERSKKQAAAAGKTDVGSGSGPASTRMPSTKLERGKVDYTKLSDDEILNG